jgi:hypothetical protein
VILLSFSPNQPAQHERSEEAHLRNNSQSIVVILAHLDLARALFDRVSADDAKVVIKRLRLKDVKEPSEGGTCRDSYGGLTA